MFVTIISFILVLGVLIFIHEFGHYITAKKVGIRVEEFALGFGPKLISHKKGDTVYSIRAIPLGGFCNMTGEFLPDDDMSEKERKIYREARDNGECFHQKPIWQRFAVIVMGPLMNFLLAVVVFISIFAIFGLPVDSSQSTIIGDLTPEKPAAKAGLQPGDEITAINNNQVSTWQEMTEHIREADTEEIKIEYRRRNKIETVFITPEYDENLKTSIIGIYPKLIREKIGLLQSIKVGVLQTGNVFYLTVKGFVTMISERSTEELGGPIMIASIVGRAARTGLSNLLSWLAIISINLGIINLLPIPALDGGRLVFLIVEFIRGKPVDPKKESFVHFIGFILLMLLMVFIIYKDIIRSIF